MPDDLIAVPNLCKMVLAMQLDCGHFMFVFGEAAPPNPRGFAEGHWWCPRCELPHLVTRWWHGG